MRRAAAIVLLLCGCNQILGVDDPVVGTDGDDAPTIDARSDGQLPTIDAPAGCVAGLAQCNNCIDDDGDGATDGMDPECTSATDDVEGGFGTGIPNDNTGTTTQDCFFDGNSGSGDDACAADTCCLIGGCTTAQLGTCPPPADCVANCTPITIAGCDCYGCCRMCNATGCFDIAISPAVSPECDYDTIADPSKCRTCTRRDDCATPCGGCELCAGQSLADLPASCNGTPTCEPGRARCDVPGDCPAGTWCSNYCCVAVPP